MSRNYVKKGMNSYLVDKCNGPTTGREFWNTVKPLISTKSMSSNDNIMLMENGEVIREPNKLCNVFNDYFVNIAKDIGINDPIKYDDTIESIISQYMHHSSIEKIKENYNGMSGFNFKLYIMFIKQIKC